MNIEESMRRVRRVQLRARGIAGTLTSGTTGTRFRGHGIEFLEVREYLPVTAGGLARILGAVEVP